MLKNTNKVYGNIVFHKKLHLKNTLIKNLFGLAFLLIISFAQVFAASLPGPPFLSTSNPLDNATGVPTNSDITLVFNEDVYMNNSMATVELNCTGPGICASLVTFCSSFSGWGTNTLTFTTGGLFANKNYNFQVASNCVRDASMITWSGLTTTTDLNFSTGAGPATCTFANPCFTPADDAVDVDVATNLVIEVDKATGYPIASYRIEVRRDDNDALVASYPYDFADPEISGLGTTTFTLNPNTNLPSDTDLYVNVISLYSTSTAEQVNIPNFNKTTWNFTTEDITAPICTIVTPLDNATNVALNANLQLSCNEPVQAGSGNIEIRRVSGGTLHESIPITDGTRVTFSGSTPTTVSIDPNNNYTSLTDYYVNIPAAAIVDTSSNSNQFAGITGTTAWNYQTIFIDTTPPTCTTFSPLDNATGVTLNSNLVITCNEPIQAGSGNFVIHNSDTSTWESIPIGDARVTIVGNTATINPSGTFSESSGYYVRMAAGVIEDLAGNAFAGILNNTTWNFTTGDFTPPTCTTFNPLDNATGVTLNSNLVITCNEPIQAGSGNFVIHNSDTSTWESIPIGDARVTIVGNTATINPSGTFNQSSGYYVRMAAGVIEDLAGNAFAGILNNTTWNFTTGDFTPPTCTTFNPLDNATGVTLNSNLVITCNEPIQAGSGNFVIHNSDTSTWESIPIGDARVTIVGNTATINPSGTFNQSSGYYVRMAAGVIEDLAGNAFAGILNNTTWNFTTGDFTPPTCTTFSPLDNATGVTLNSNLVITCNEPIQAGSGNFVIHNSDTSTWESIPIGDARVTIVGNTATINPSGTFSESSGYYVRMAAGVIEDLAGNAFAGILNNTTWNFTTGDFTPPTCTTFNPLDNATGVTLNSNLVITCNEPIQAGSGNFVIHNSDTSTWESIPIGDARVTIVGNTATINPSGTFNQSSGYYVRMAAGVIEDLAGNAFAGILNNTTWNFTTGDFTPPTCTTFNPLDNATGVTLNSNLVITCNEPIQAGSGNFVIHNSDTSTWESIPIGDARVTIVGNTATINPSGTFSESSGYYVRMAAGVIEDLAGNAFAGILNNTTWNFTTGDFTPPTCTTFNPLDNATGVTLNSNLVITCNEPIQAGSGNFVIHNSDTSTWESIPIGDARITIVGNQVTINPSGTFASSSGYYVRIAAGVIEDLAGNAFAGILNNTTWNFTTGDFTPPTCTTFNPLDNATNVGANDNLVLTCSEAIQAGTGNIVIHNSDTSTWESIPIGDARITIVGNQVTINPSGTFASLSGYYVRIAAGVIEDLAGNAFAGILNNTTWNFTTGDFTPPTCTTFNPLDNATGVTLNSNLVITCNEPIQAGSGNFVIHNSDTSTWESIPIGDARVTIVGNTATINPSGTFSESSGYYVRMAAGVIEDLAGNAFAGILNNTTWNFTTGDFTPPTCTTFNPLDNATGVTLNSNLVITCNEPIQAGSGNFVIHNSDTSTWESIPIGDARVTIVGNTATINPSGTFNQSSGYYVRMAAGVIEDLAGNAFAGILNNTTWNFTTGDFTPPTCTTFNPLDNATGVTLNSNLVITCNEPIQAGSGNFVIHNSDTSTWESIPIGDARVTIVGNTATINPSGTFSESSGYYVRMAAGVIEDLAGNAFAGILNNTTWNFTTGDFTPPTCTTFSPLDNATGVTLNSNLVITCNEPIQAGSGNFVIHNSDTSTWESIPIGDARVTIVGNTATINPSGTFSESSGYYVRMAAGVIEDLAGNTFAGILNNTTWNFTTGDFTPPTCTTFNPLDNATGVTLNSNLVITCNEPIQAGSGNFVIHNSDTSTWESIPIGDARVTIVGNTATINPSGTFSESSGYYVRIAAGVIEDLAGNAFAGILNNTTWNFTTGDFTPPTCTTFNPLDNATNVGANDNLVLTCSEAIQAGTGNIVIHNSDTSTWESIPIGDARITIVGNQVTINPSGTFASSSGYYVRIAAGVIEDLAGNAFAGILNNTTWNFTTGDFTAPTCTTFNPLDNATNVGANDNLVLTCSEAVQAGTGNIVIHNSDTSTWESIPIGDARITIVGNQVTINPSGTFASSSGYYVRIAAGVIEDLAGNNFAGILNNTTWNFTTGDFTAPTCTTFNPLDNATGVGINDNLVLTCSEAIQAGTGNIVIHNSDTSTWESIPIGDARITIVGNQVTINPSGTFASLSGYYVRIAAGVIEDLAGNAFAGILNNTTWNFTAADVTAPTCTTFNPLDNATGVGVNDNLVLTCSEAVQAGTGNIVIHNSDTSTWESIPIGDARITIVGNQVTIDPSGTFASSASYYVRIAAGVIEDLAGNAFAGILNNTTWNFTAADVTAPTCTTFNPLDNATGVGVNDNLVLTCSENIQAGTGNIVIHNSDTSTWESIPIGDARITIVGNQVTINPSGTFASLSGYYVRIAAGVIEDLAGNAFAGILNNTTWNFTSADVTAPTCTTFNPLDNATGVGVNDNLVLTCSEAVQAGTGNIVIHNSDTSVFETIPIGDARITIVGNQVTINPSGTFASLSGYYVRIAAGVIEDTSGNDFAGILTNTTWNFTTADVVAPTCTTFNPLDNATGVGVNDNLILTCSEAVQAGTGNIVIHNSDTSVFETIPIGDARITIVGNQVTINPSGTFASLSGYYVRIAAGVIEDTSGNDFAGILTNTTWNFTTADVVAPTCTTFNPLDNATGVGANDNLVLTCSENIQAGTGNIVIHNSDTSTWESIPIGDARVTIVGNQVTINPSGTFASSSGYYVRIAAGVIEDLAGNTFAGILNNTTWNFTTGDFTPPTCTTFNPLDNATGVGVNDNLVLTCSENIQAGTGNIVIHNSDTSVFETIPIGDARVTIVGNQVTIDPSGTFASLSGYYVRIAAGVIEDTSSNAFAGILNNTTWNFTTADVVAPTCTTFNPLDNATGVGVNDNLVLTCSEAIQAGTGNIVIHNSDTSTWESIPIGDARITIVGNQVTINPSGTFASSASYYVRIASGVIEDLAGNDFAGILSNTIWNFTAADVVAPTCTNYNPADNATGVPLTANLVLTCSENIQAGTGNIVIHNSDTSTFESIPIGDARITIVGNQVTIDPTASFASSAGYYVRIAAGVIEDTSGNDFAGILTNTTWNFTAVDAGAPTCTFTPADDATGVGLNANLVLSCSEPIQAGTGNIVIHNSDTSVFETIPIGDARVTIVGSTVTVNPSGTFASLSGYYVNIASGVIEDLASNAYAGVAGTTTWNFTTLDNVAPTCTTFNPLDNATGVGVNDNLVLTCSENVQAGTGNIVIHNSDTSVFETIPIGDARVTIVGNQVTIDPSGTFASLSGYYVRIATGVIEDTSSNAFAGILNNTTWNFTTADIVAPTCTTFNPLDNATGVGVNDNLVLTCSENIQAGTGNIVIHNSDTSTWESIPIGDARITIVGNQVTINPSGTFASSASYYVRIASGVIEDLAGNDFAGILSNTIWNFTAADVTAPTCTTFSPLDDATGVGVNDNLVLTCSENVQAGTGNIIIHNSDTSTWESIPIGDARITIVGNQVTINPSGTFASLSGYYVRIAAGVIEDIAGNAFAGILNNTTWNFTTADVGVPTCTSFNPLDNATGVGVNDNLVLTCSENVQAGTGNIVIHNSDTSIFETIPIGDARITIVGNQVTINPSGTFASLSGYYVRIAAGVIEDLSSNAFAGILNNTTWNFTTADVVAPTCTTFSPLDDATGVGVNDNLVLTCSENIQAGTGNIVIHNSDTSTFESIPIGDARITIVGNQVTINPSGTFASLAGYYVRIAAGVIEDTSGNAFAGILTNTTWNFTTADVVAPTCTTFSPLDDATGVGVNDNLVLTCSENIQAGTGNIVIHNSDTSTFESIPIGDARITIVGNQVTIDPSGTFASLAGYYVRIAAGVIEDTSGNAFAGILTNTTWNFTTADIVAPTCTTFNPADNATGVGLNDNLVLTCSENIQAGTGNIVIHNSDTSTWESIPIGDARITIVGNQVTIDPSGTFTSSAAYYVRIAAGVIEDLAGNNFAGILNNTTWNFTAADAGAPTCTFTPVDDATGVGLNANLVLSCSEPVQAGTGNIVIHNSDTSVFETIPIGDARVTIVGSTVTVNPSGTFASLSGYYVNIASGVIEDLASNAYAGVAGTTTWNFTTLDNVAPTCTTFSPLDDATGVGVNDNLVLTCSENIQAGTGNIVIHNSDTSVFESIPIGDARITIVGNQVTINPSGTFASLSGYYVNLGLGVIEDLAGNDFAGILNNTTWNFTTADVVAPTCTTFSPLDDATGVGVNDNLVLTCSENIQAGTGNIVIHNSDTSTFESIPIGDARITIVGNQVTINPSGTFASLSGYYVRIAAGVIEDTSGNSFAGILNNTTWNFTTADVTAPTCTTFSPLDDATGVGINDNLVLTCSENIQAGTGNIVIHNSDTSTFESIPIGDARITIVGNQVTIDPSGTFASLAGYYVRIASGVIEDTAGNAFAGILTNTTWNFTTADVTAPTCTTFNPVDDATGVGLNDNLVLTCSENIQAGTGNIIIHNSDTSTWESIPIGDARITIVGNQVTIDPSGTFTSSAAYYVRIAAGVIEDLAGNNFAGILNNTTWNFTAADAGAPTCTFTPADDATGVGLNANLVLSCSEPVQAGTGNIVIHNSDTSVFETIPIGDARVTIVGSTVTVNPSGTFVSLSGYYVNIASGVIEDLASNAYAGVAGTTTWNFTTLDNVAPTCTTFSPLDDATGVGVNDNLVLTCSENIQAGTGNIVIHNSDTSTFESIPIGDARITIVGNQVTINPSGTFASLSGYYVRIAAGVIEDTSGNAFAGILTNTAWNFTTADVVAPTCTTFSPLDDATGVGVNDNLVLTCSENIQAGTGNIVIHNSDTSTFESIPIGDARITIVGNQVTINPSGTFASLSGYYVRIAAGVIEDTSGNAFAGILTNTTWNFTTADVTAPTCTTFSPLDDATGVGINDNLVLTCSENIQAGTGNIVIHNSDTSTWESIPIGDARITIVGNQVTINPSGTFASLASYYVRIAAGVIEDTAGNAFAGILTNTTWNFTAADAGAPTCTFTPADDATGVGLNANLVLSCSEPVQAGTGNIVIHNSDTSVFETIPIGDARVTIVGSTVTVDPSGTFASSAGYYVNIASGVIEDLASNAYAGVAGTTTWNFTTLDNVAPTCTTFSPLDDAINVITSSNLVLTCNENVQAGTGNIVIHNADTSVFESIPIGDARITIVGNTVTVDPSATFANSSLYYINIASGVIEDTSGNAFTGIAGTTTWNFTTVGGIVGWYSSAWGRRVRITIDSSQVTSDLTNFPVYVDLSDLPASFFANVQADGADIRVTTADGMTAIPTELVNINTGGSTGELYFRATSISSTVDTDFYIYYDNPGARMINGSEDLGFQRVWSNNYVGVYHMDELPGNAGALLWDSSSFRNHGAPNGAMINANLVAGNTGNSIDFDGTNDFLFIQDSPSINTATGAAQNRSISYWMNSTNIGSSVIMEKGNDANLVHRLTTGNIQAGTNTVVGNYANSVTAVNDGLWHFVSHNYDGVANILYVDSGPAEAVTAETASIPTADPLTIGSGIGGTEAYDGLLDEVRISNTDRSPAWVNATYSNINNTATFYTVAAEDLVTDTSDPKILSVYPENKSVQHPLGHGLRILFSEVVNVNVGNIVIHRYSDDAIFETIDVTVGARVSGGGTNTITVSTTADFAAGEKYYVLIDQASFEDGASNPFSGIVDKDTWTFTTQGSNSIKRNQLQILQ
jgi:methionine-rich copper-binding protein CopC